MKSNTLDIIAKISFKTFNGLIATVFSPNE